MQENKKVAVFIDAENVPSSTADQIFNTASEYGNIIIKKIYGDWSKKSLNQWKAMIGKYSIVAEQQFSFVSGKNTSDFPLVIQVLLTLFEKDIDVFVIVSSDSDFTRLVQELRERKKEVIGFGDQKAIASYVNSFSEFIYFEDENTKSSISQKGNKPKDTSTLVARLGKEKLNALRDIIDTNIDNNGKAYYAQISNEMKNKYSDFLPKNYGFKLLKDFIAELVRTYFKNYKINEDGTVFYLTAKK